LDYVWSTETGVTNGIGVLGMKPMANGIILKSKTVSPVVFLGFAAVGARHRRRPINRSVVRVRRREGVWRQARRRSGADPIAHLLIATYVGTASAVGRCHRRDVRSERLVADDRVRDRRLYGAGHGLRMPSFRSSRLRISRPQCSR
jgi:hypothetical protein